MDINNNVVNNNILANNVAANNVAVNNVAVNNVAVNNVAANNVAVNNVAATNNLVVNNQLLNNSSVVNSVNPNNLDYLNDNMNVLSNADNSAANTVGTNNRDSRRFGDVSGYDSIGDIHDLGKHLLMNGTNGYNLEKRNNLTGNFNGSVRPNNNASISGAEVPPPSQNNSNRNNRNNRNNRENMLGNNVSGYNGNNLIKKNPFPGNNVNFQVEPQKAELNVSGYNKTEYEQLTVNNTTNNNIVEKLTVEEPFANSHEHFQNNNSQLNQLNNLIQFNGVNSNNREENLNNVLNNVPQQLVLEDNKVKINNIINNNVENVEELPQSILFTSPKQLQDAQDRSVYCEGTKNNGPIVSANDSHSAQGYNLPGNINGFNQYGAQAINYLCVSDKC